MLDYLAGRHRLSFDGSKYDFRSLMLAGFNQYAESLGGEPVGDLTELHKLPKINTNVEQYRQAAFSLFRAEAFQTLFKSFGADLIDTYFQGVGLIQKTPTIRIQLPKASSTSYHSDGWYGHGESVRSFWMPLTPVGDGNTLYMSENVERSLRATDDILNAKASLSQINDIARDVCTPFEGDFGDILSFSSKMLHGAEPNKLNYTRVSFDFRIAPNAHDLGSKPLSNFFSREDLKVKTSSVSNVVKNDKKLCGITYSNLCNGKSAKSQLLLCAAHADVNNIDIIGNESEIVTLEYMPVIRNYLLEDNPQTNCIVVFGVDIFEGNKELAIQIMNCADQGKRKIVFCAEGVVYGDDNLSQQAVLDLISRGSN